MNELHISTGVVTLNIFRDGEEVGIFKFNPKDLGEAEKYADLMHDMQSKKTDYLKKAKELDESGTDTERVKFLAEYIREMRKGIDGVYGEGTCQLLFGNALDIDMFFDFMEGIAPYYKKASSERTAKYRKHSSK